MPKIAYKSFNFRSGTLEIIKKANEFVEEYEAMGYQLTLRQLFYRFVSLDLIPNTLRSYKRIGSIINDARLAGMIDWRQIVDDLRSVEGNSHWDDPEDIVGCTAKDYGIDTRVDQDTYMEVWVEKNALVRIVRSVCNPLDVKYLSCRGYVSQSAMWRASLRMLSKEEEGKGTTIIHLGDHDPSGIDMTRDIQDRLNLFGSRVEVERVALNMDQIEQYGPPPNPAKSNDARFESYITEYGTDSWELDALDPPVLSAIIKEAVEKYTDEERWQVLVDRREEEREQLQQVSDRWSEVVEFLED